MAAVNDPTFRYATLSFATDGVQTDWPISFAGGYIHQSDVLAYSVLNTDPIISTNRTPHDLIFVSESGTSAVVRIEPAVASGRTLVIYRNTEKTEPLVSYENGSILVGSNLDLSAKQAVFSAAEFMDRAGSIEETSQLAYDAILAAQADDLDFSNLQYLATKAEVAAQADALADPSTGADLVGYAGETVKEYLDNLGSSLVTIPNLASATGSQGVGFKQSGAGAITKTLESELRLNINVKQFGAVGDGVVDDYLAIQAALNEAQARGGGAVYFPAGIYMHTQTLHITVSGVRLQGDATGYGHDAAGADHPSATLAWGGAAGGDQLVISSPTGGNKINSCGVSGLMFDSKSVAGRGVVILSHNLGDFGPLYMANHTIAGMYVGCTTLVAGEAADSQANRFHNLFFRNITSGTNTGKGLWLGGQTGANTSLNVFDTIAAQYNNGTFMYLENCDNNVFFRISGFRLSSGIGVGIDMRGSNTAAIAARANHFFGCSPGKGTIVVRGTGLSNPSKRNTVYGFDKENGTPSPVIEAGAQLQWTTDDGVTNNMGATNLVVTDAYTTAASERANLGVTSLRIRNGAQAHVALTDGVNEWAIRIDGDGNLIHTRVSGTGGMQIGTWQAHPVDAAIQGFIQVVDQSGTLRKLATIA